MLSKSPSRRAALLAGFILVGVFATGVGAGLAGSRLLCHPGPPGGRPPHDFSDADPDFLPPPFERFDLDAAQRERARPIVARHRGEMRALVEQTLPAIRAARSSFEREMRAVLTPDQAQRLDAFLAREPPRPPLPGLGPPPPP
jgi:hypothetical protein